MTDGPFCVEHPELPASVDAELHRELFELGSGHPERRQQIVDHYITRRWPPELAGQQASRGGAIIFWPYLGLFLVAVAVMLGSFAWLVSYVIKGLGTLSGLEVVFAVVSVSIMVFSYHAAQALERQVRRYSWWG